MIKGKKNINLELITECLVKFIKENKNNPDIRFYRISLDEKSVNGRRIEISENVWGLGEWAIQKDDSLFIARLSKEYSKAETIVLKVNINEKDNKYIVKKWDIQKTWK